MEEKNIFSWLAAIMIAVGLWMFYVALTGYFWWFTVIQKTNWVLFSTILTFFGIAVFIIEVLGSFRRG